MPQHQPFTYIVPPTHATPIACPHCGGAAVLARREAHPETKAEIRVFECRDCGKTSATTVPE